MKISDAWRSTQVWLKRIVLKTIRSLIAARGFKSYLLRHMARQFRWLEYQTVTLEVVGSIPIRVAIQISAVYIQTNEYSRYSFILVCLYQYKICNQYLLIRLIYAHGSIKILAEFLMDISKVTGGIQSVVYSHIDIMFPVTNNMFC